MPYQWQWVLDLVELTPEQCQQAAWAVTNESRMYTKYRGAAAIHVVLGELMGIGLLSYKLYKRQPNRAIQDRAYQWVADHRRYFPSTTPAIQQERPWQPEQRA